VVLRAAIEERVTAGAPHRWARSGLL
jgi:hypothetical protein